MKTVKVKVDVDSDSVQFADEAMLSLTQKVKLLKRELQTVPEGTAEWQTLQKAFNENKDALDRVNIKSKELFGTMSALPGPIGGVSAALDNSIDTLKTFTSMKFGDIKKQFGEVISDVKDIAKNIGNATGITKLYERASTALAGAFTRVGIAEETAAVGARAFSAALIATGIGAIVVALGLGVSKLWEWADGSKAAAEAQRQFNEELDNAKKIGEDNIDYLKRNSAERTAQLKKQGATEEEIRKEAIRLILKEKDETFNALREGEAKEDAIKKRRDANSSEDLKKQQEENRNLNKKFLELQSAYLVARDENETASNKESVTQNKEASAKRLADDKEAFAKRLAIIKANGSQEVAALKLEEQKRLGVAGSPNEKIKIEEEYAEKAYQSKLAELQKEATLYSPDSVEGKAIITAITNLETEKLKTAQDFTDKRKREQERQVKTMEDGMKQAAEDQKVWDDAKSEAEANDRNRKLSGIQDEIDALNKLNDAREMDFQADLARFEEKRTKLHEQKAIELQNVFLTEKERNEIIKRYAKEEEQLDKDVTATKKAELESRYAVALSITNSIAGIGKILQDAAGKNKSLAKAGLLIEQAAGIATIVINTQKNAAKAGYLTPAGIAEIVAGTVGVASAVMATIKGIKQIDAVNVGSTSSGPSNAMPSFSSMQITAPSLGNTQPAQQSQLGGIIGNAVTRNGSQDRPIRAYVVGNDITTEQQLDRRVRNAARLG